MGVPIRALASSVSYRGLDVDAADYIRRVEDADKNYLEPIVRYAINNFVRGCKDDAIWSALKASCLLMGARTVAGALTPLVGSAPTNVGPFVAGDYTRGGTTPGLQGNGSTKAINTGRAGNADGQDDCHFAAWLTVAHTEVSKVTGGADLSNVVYEYPFSASAFFRLRTPTGGPAGSGSTFVTGFRGMSRASSTNYTVRHQNDTTTITATSTAPPAENWRVFRYGAATDYTGDARICFYSIGSALTLTLLESRVSSLINALRDVA